MRRTTTWLAKQLIDRPLDLLPRRQRIRLLRHLLDRARGDNNMVAETNGEYRVLAELRPELARRSAVAFDVGANVGDWTVELCEGREEPLRVYAFEPSAATFRHLSERLSGMRTGARVQAVNAAMGSAAGQAVLNVFSGQELAGSNSIVARPMFETAAGGPGAETVRVVTGDEFCAENGITELGFVKIDTEGFELEVLKGLRGMLSRSAVGALQFEYGGTWLDARIFLKDAFELLEPLGYTLAKIFPDGVRHLRGYDPELETFLYANFLAIREDWLKVFTRAD